MAVKPLLCQLWEQRSFVSTCYFEHCILAISFQELGYKSMKRGLFARKLNLLGTFKVQAFRKHPSVTHPVPT